jgi:hypothetical protein
METLYKESSQTILLPKISRVFDGAELFRILARPKTGLCPAGNPPLSASEKGKGHLQSG